MARMTTGKDSKQDYRTPKQLVAAIEARFGKIRVDLAADFVNRVADLYFCAPDVDMSIFTVGNELGPMVPSSGLLGRDCLVQNWASFQAQYPGIFFDNCPFNNIKAFSEKHKEEMVKGCESLLLIPDDATKAYKKNVIGHADVYRLVGRVGFKVNPETGKRESFPKDCCVAHYYPGNDCPKYLFWDWKRDMILHTFKLE